MSAVILERLLVSKVGLGTRLGTPGVDDAAARSGDSLSPPRGEKWYYKTQPCGARRLALPHFDSVLSMDTCNQMCTNKSPKEDTWKHIERKRESSGTAAVSDKPWVINDSSDGGISVTSIFLLAPTCWELLIRCHYQWVVCARVCVCVRE